MRKILAIAGSNHATSIHYQLVEFTASLIEGAEVTVLDMRGWKIPVYSIDFDPDQTPNEITELIMLMEEYDGFIIASPEHNGSISAFFKNILDWLSRRKKQVFEEKPVLLMSTSPSEKGGTNGLDYLLHALPYQGAEITSTFSLSSFQKNFKEGQIIRPYLEDLQSHIGEFMKLILSRI